MAENEYISISEFAKRAGVSNAYVYKALSTRLSAYYKLVDNKKMLNIKALELFVDNQIDNNKSTMDSIVEELREQLKVKDKQIEKLQTALDQEQKLHLATKQELGQIKRNDEVLEIAEASPEGSSLYDELTEEQKKDSMEWGRKTTKLSRIWEILKEK